MERVNRGGKANNIKIKAYVYESIRNNSVFYCCIDFIFLWWKYIFFGRYVVCLSICLSALTHPYNVLIKSNITRKRFEARYSNLEHWSYLMPCTIQPDMTSLAISGHVSAAIFIRFKKISQFNISKLVRLKFTKFETLIDNDVSFVSFV